MAMRCSNSSKRDRDIEPCLIYVDSWLEVKNLPINGDNDDTYGYITTGSMCLNALTFDFLMFDEESNCWRDPDNLGLKLGKGYPDSNGFTK